MEDFEQDGEVHTIEGELADPNLELVDGGAIAKIEGEPDAPTPAKVSEFYANLTPELADDVLDTMATELMDAVEEDKKARRQRDKDYAEAQKRTGLGKQAPGGADFEGASRVVHPMLLEACMDFEARAIRELLPPGGPVKIHLPGENIEGERIKKAERKKTYMNWQFQFQMEEFRSELEQLLTQLPLGGAMYLRLVPDSARRRMRPVPTFVPIDFVSIPSTASSYYTALRQCYWEPVNDEEFKLRVEDGLYRSIPLSHSGIADQTESEKAADKVEGKDVDQQNDDGTRRVCEISVDRDLGLGEGRVPYLISIDVPSTKVVSIVRNWEHDDKYQDRMQWMSEWLFFPWRGAQGIGLGQAVGSIAGAATGALRALLDSAHIQNIPTMARLKGANFSGQSKTVNATQVIEIEGGVAADNDIRKLLMPIPFAGPSETLFKLLGFLTDTGRQALHVALDKLSEDNKNLPVGTTLALIEEGMKVMSAIHLRLFHAMSRTINILHRINRMYLEDEELEGEAGEVLAYRTDFQGPLDCIPTADPEIFSDVQRIAQAQIIADRAAAIPGVYNQRATELFLLERAKIPNPERFLVPQPTPEEMSQVNENVAMSLGRPVTAFPEQDHLAHIQILVDFMMNPTFGMNPIIAPDFLQPALTHLKEHIVLWYANAYYETLRDALEEQDDGMGRIMRERDPETRRELDQTLLAGSKLVYETVQQEQVFQVLPQVIEQAQKMIEQLTPPMLGVDPAKMAAVQQKYSADKTKERIADKKLASEEKGQVISLQAEREARQSDGEQNFLKLSAKEKEVALQEAQESARQAEELAARLQELMVGEGAENERARLDREADERRNTQDNLTALRVAAAEIKSSEKVTVSTGKGANKNPSGARPRG